MNIKTAKNSETKNKPTKNNLFDTPQFIQQCKILKSKGKTEREIRSEIRKTAHRKHARLRQTQKKARETETNILTALAQNEELTFQQLLDITGYSRQTLTNYLTKLHKQKIINKRYHKNQTLHSLRKPPPDIQFIPLTTQFLAQLLKTDTHSFTQQLGSLILFLIDKNKTHLIQPLLSNIHFLTKLEKQLTEKLTSEWKIWEDALKTSYTQEQKISLDGTTYKKQIITPNKFIEKWLKKEEPPHEAPS